MEDEKIWRFLLEKIGNEFGVGALMGNLYVESKLNPKLLEGSYARKFGLTSEQYTNAVDNGSYTKDTFANDSAGYGLAQWTYWSRKQALYEYAKARNDSIGDLDMQLNYLWEELQKYKTVIKACMEATSVREASDVIVKKYEKPKNQTEKFLENRAKYGQGFYDKFTGGESMNTAEKVLSMLTEWQKQGLSKPQIVVNLANACIGWSYVFGARGEKCTPANRRAFYNSKKKETIKTKCKNFNGDKGCSGCQWYPSGVTLFYDCRGFTYWCFLKGAGISIKGAGASSQYNDNSNWDEKGDIANMPKDKVCCVFRYDKDTKKYEHTLLYDGNGNYIHCSGTVKKCKSSAYKATHYAIPKNLYSGGGDIPVAQAKVIASSGDTVNMRSQPSKTASVITQVPVGKIVDVYEKGSEWCKIGYQNLKGYMMTKFLDFGETPSGDTITVSKADLETIYKMVGQMLEK